MAWRDGRKNIGYGFGHAGGPEVIDAIDLPTPQPGPHEIQIKTSAIGLNNRDRMARQLGCSGLTGTGIRCCRYRHCAREPMFLSLKWAIAWWREQPVPMRNRHCRSRHERLVTSFDYSGKGVAVITPGVTGYRMVELGNVKAGDTVIVKGASGGVGSAAIQLAVARGASRSSALPAAVEVAVERLGVEHLSLTIRVIPSLNCARTADVVINAAMNGLGGDDDVAMTKTTD